MIAGALIFWDAYFGQGSGPVLFLYLGCTGNEDRLEHCTYSSSLYYASHTTDVGVKCSERGYYSYVTHDVLLPLQY